MVVKVYLVGRPAFDKGVFRTFLREHGTGESKDTGLTEPEEIVEAAARICYMSFNSESAKSGGPNFIRERIEGGHDSVLEHVSWIFIITGVSRSLSHQLVRHRVGFSFSQLSQQYCDHSKALFVEPFWVKDSPRVAEIWREAVEKDRKAYVDILMSLEGSELLKRKVLDKDEVSRAIRSVARSVLPNATETKLLMTANARALRYFFSLRGSIPGDEEMRRLAAELLELVKREAPSIFFDFEVEHHPDGSVGVKDLRRNANFNGE